MRLQCVGDGRHDFVESQQVQRESPLDLLELILFSLLGLLASQVVSGFARDGEVEKRRP